MNPDLAIVLVLLALAILMFAFNRPRADAVAMIAMAVLPFTGAVTTTEAIAGFSNPNVVLIAAMFVIGEALARTGVAQRIGDWLARTGGTSPWRLLVLLMLAVGLLGSVMRSTGVVAIFIPAVLRIASQTGLPAAQLLMPMAYAALISGTLTLVATSSNLVINYELVRTGAAGFGFFDFTPFGLPILAVGVLYTHLARRWLSPDVLAARGPRRPRLMHWVEHYRLADRELRVRVPEALRYGKGVGVGLIEVQEQDVAGFEGQVFGTCQEAAVATPAAFDQEDAHPGLVRGLQVPKRLAKEGRLGPYRYPSCTRFPWMLGSCRCAVGLADPHTHHGAPEGRPRTLHVAPESRPRCRIHRIRRVLNEEQHGTHTWLGQRADSGLLGGSGELHAAKRRHIGARPRAQQP